MFTAPLIKPGAAVLSLGHPPQAKDRQNEMHGSGSTAWLDEVDGVGFRMIASKEHPMIEGGKGHSALYVAKDRWSKVKRGATSTPPETQPWYYMGAFIVDDEPKADNLAAKTEVRLNVPTKDGDKPKSKESTLAGHVEAALEKRTGRFDSVNQLKGFLAADEIRYTATHLPVALEILVSQGRLLWPEGC